MAGTPFYPNRPPPPPVAPSPYAGYPPPTASPYAATRLPSAGYSDPAPYAPYAAGRPPPPGSRPPYDHGPDPYGVGRAPAYSDPYPPYLPGSNDRAGDPYASSRSSSATRDGYDYGGHATGASRTLPPSQSPGPYDGHPYDHRPFDRPPPPPAVASNPYASARSPMPRETEWSGRTLAQQERHPSSSDTRSSYLHQTPYGQAPPPRAYSQGLSDPRGSAPHSYDARVAAPGPARAEWDRPAAGRSMNPSSSVGMSKPPPGFGSSGPTPSGRAATLPGFPSSPGAHPPVPPTSYDPYSHAPPPLTSSYAATSFTTREPYEDPYGPPYRSASDSRLAMRDYADALHSRGRPLRPQISPDGGHPGAPKPPPLPRSLRGYRRDSLSPDASRGRRYSRSISPRRSPSPRRRLSHRSRSPPPRVPPSEFYRRDDARWREDYKDRASKTGTKTQPSRDIILLGLDADVDETRLQDMLVGMAGSPDVLATSPVTVIRDRNTGVSKGFGFAKFATLETAITFMDKHAPYLEGTERWTGPPPPGCDGHDTGRRRRIKVDFSQTERPQGRSYYNMHHPPERPESREPANSHEQSRSAGSNVPALQGSAVPTEVGPQSAEGESSRLADNDGMRHIGSEPSTVLLLRGVPSGTSAASLGRKLIGMKDPNWEDRTFAGKLECVFLVRARAARAGELGAPLGFAFARCNDTESAQALLSAAHDPWAFPTGFRISADEENQAESSAVGLTFAADAVFVEVNPDDPRDAAWSFKDRHGKSWLYADEHAGVEVWDASTEASHQRPDSQSEAGPQQAENADATTANGNNSVANSAAPHEPAADAQMTDAPIETNNGSNQSHATSTIAPDPASEHVASRSIHHTAHPTAVETSCEKFERTKKVPPLATSKKVALNISKWNTKQEELHASGTPSSTVNSNPVGNAQKTPSSVKEAFASESDAEMQDSPVVDIGSAQAETPIEFDFSDVGRIACLLCQRQFKSAEMMRRHEKESDLHKARILIFLSFIHQVAFVLCAGKLDAWRRTDERNLIAHWLTNVHGAMRFASLFMWICCHSQRNLQDPVTRKLGAERKLGAKMTTAGSGASFAPIGSAGSSTSATPGGNASQPPSVDENVPKYRNRALERRAVFGAEAPGADRKRPERKAFEGPAAPTAAPAPKNAEGIEASNVGSKMLQSMGWTAGSGLGAGGEGRVDPVQAQLYAQGAGLGSSKGHEAGKFEDGWKGYLQQAKEGARQRYGEP